MSVTQSLNLIRKEIGLQKSQNTERWDHVERRLSEIEARLDNLTTPAQTHAKKPDGRKTRIKTPAPDRPAVMKAAGVGADPR